MAKHIILTTAGLIKSVSIVYREDLDLKNHLAGHQRRLMKISFENVQALMEVRNELMPTISKNKIAAKRSDAYALLATITSSGDPASTVAVPPPQSDSTHSFYGYLF
jgi:hypothetical protein